jgi:hypothetical protein
MIQPRRCIAIDYDGVIHRCPHWHPGTCDEIDTTGIDLAHHLGFTVAVMTCGELPQIAQALRAHGHAVVFAPAREPWNYQHWQGGRSGRTVLVTGWKVHALAYIDDKAVRFRYGQDWQEALAEITQAPEPVR